ncbi:MAG: 8-oxo-dGTP pyrophosphatase MutT (NUDIX family) [Oceanicoccus sp.]|jgi:8-oxo-dGTP pyrophosphatase MutT (NUDIX family)
MTDTQAEIVIPRPAATVMLIDDRPELQVYMMKRSSRTVFGGMWVFPGGTVDPDDKLDLYETHCRKSDVEASKRLEVDKGGLAYYVAAIRETFEEAGIMLALIGESDKLLSMSAAADKARYHEYRGLVHSGELPLSQIIETEDLILDTASIHYVARWITPPVVPKRFDTRFFLARMPQDQHPIHDDKELVNSGWFEPADLIKRAAAGEIAVMAPTLRMLESLVPFEKADDAMQAASIGRDAIRVPFSDGKDSSIPAALSGVEPGWVYLRP